MLNVKLRYDTTGLKDKAGGFGFQQTFRPDAL